MLGFTPFNRLTSGPSFSFLFVCQPESARSTIDQYLVSLCIEHGCFTFIIRIRQCLNDARHHAQSPSLSEQLWRHIPPNSVLIQIRSHSSAVLGLTFSSFSWDVDGASQGIVASQVPDPSRVNKSTVTDHTKDFPAAYMRESSSDRAIETDQPKLDLLDIISAQRIYSASSATCS